MNLISSVRPAGPHHPPTPPRRLAVWPRFLTLVCLGMLATQLATQGVVRGQDLPIEPAPLDRAEPVDFGKEILPILKRNCLACHHRNEAEGGLNLETYAALIEGGDGGAGIVPREVDESYVFIRAAGREEPLMPPEGNSVGAKPLTPEELALLQLWIQQGAPGGEAANGDTIQWQTIPQDLQPVYALASSPGGRFVASGKANQVVIYDAATMEPLSQLVDPALSTAERAVAGRDIVQSIAFSPDGKTIATGGYRTVRLWELADGQLATQDSPFANAAGLVAAKADGSRVAVVNAIGDIEIWNASEPALLQTLQGHAATIRGLVWAGDLDRLFSVDDAGTLIVWEPSRGKRLTRFETNKTPARLAVSADGSKVVLADIQGQLHLWNATTQAAESDAADQEPTVGLVAQTDPAANAAVKALLETKDATDVTFAAAPNALVVARRSGQAVLLDLAAGQVLRTLDHGAPLTAVVTGGSPQRVVTAAADGTNRLWDFASGDAVAELGGDPALQLQLAAAQSDVDRQIALVKRLTDKKTELEKLAKSEAEAFAKIKESRDQAVEAAKTAKQKWEAAQAELAKTQMAAEQNKQALAQNEAALTTAQQTLANAEAMAKAEAEAKVKAEAEAKAKAEAEAEPPAGEAATEESPASAPAEAPETEAAGEQAETPPAEVKPASPTAAEQRAAAQEKVATLQQQQKALQEKAKTFPAAIEKAQKGVTDAETAFNNSEAERAKRQQAFETAEQANQRATAAVPAQAQRIALEQRRQEALQQRQQDLQATRDAARQPFVAGVLGGPQGERIVLATADGTVRSFRTADGAAIDQFQVAGPSPAGLLLTDANRLLVYGTQGPAGWWSLQPHWDLRQTIGSPDATLISDRVTALDFHPDGQAIAVGSGPPSRFGEVKIFAVHHGQPLREWGEIHSDTVFAVAFSPDGRRLASAAADKTIRLLDVVSGKQLRSLEGHTHHVLALAWQDDGQTLASASADQTVKVWNTETGEQKRTITGFPKEITALTFLGNSPQIATACADGNVRIHDVNNGKGIRTFNAGGDFLFTTAADNEAKTLTAGGQSGVLRTWTVADGKLLHETN